MFVDRRSLIGLFIYTAATCFSTANAPAATPAASSVSSSMATPSSQSWRYKYHNGRWWYWLPSNSWAMYENDRWVAYKPNRITRYSRDLDFGLQTWPRGRNGSDPYASPDPGGAAYNSNPRAAWHTPSSNWPNGRNGSDPYAAPDPGAGRFQPEAAISSRFARPTLQQQIDDEYKWRNN